MSTTTFTSRVHSSRLRLVGMVAVGIVVAVVVGTLGSWVYAPALGWAAASAVYLALVWGVAGRLDAAATSLHALRDDPGRKTSDLLVLLGVAGSFGGVALILTDASSTQGGAKAGVIALALGCVALSWLLVHTLYMLRYASLYYRQNDGVDFNERKSPRYMDFAYLSFTVGMTFQVSDTDLTSDTIRSTALRHAILSYVLGAIVVATTINLVAGLIH